MKQQTYGEWMRSNPSIPNLTAVEWLQSKVLYIVPSSQKDDLLKLFEQAKQMEKEQIIDAHYQGYRNDIGTTEVSEQYYNETFNQIK